MKCFICGEWEYRSVVEGRSDTGELTFDNFCSDEACEDKPFCHVECKEMTGMSECQDCNYSHLEQEDGQVNAMLDDLIIPGGADDDDTEYYFSYVNNAISDAEFLIDDFSLVV